MSTKEIAELMQRESNYVLDIDFCQKVAASMPNYVTKGA